MIRDYLPGGIAGTTPVATAMGVELHFGYGDGTVYFAVFTEEQEAETLYGLLRWQFEGKHLGTSWAS